MITDIMSKVFCLKLRDAYRATGQRGARRERESVFTHKRNGGVFATSVSSSHNVGLHDPHCSGSSVHLIATLKP